FRVQGTPSAPPTRSRQEYPVCPPEPQAMEEGALSSRPKVWRKIHAGRGTRPGGRKQSHPTRRPLTKGPWTAPPAPLPANGSLPPRSARGTHPEFVQEGLRRWAP